MKSQKAMEKGGDEGMVLVKNDKNMLPLAENSNINRKYRVSRNVFQAFYII